MAKRPTISDLAEAAGVGVATVDRVLNGRARVREETARRVFEAARSIGYHGAGLIGQRIAADLPAFTIGYVLHKEKQAFYQAFRAEAEKAAERASGMRVRVLFEFSPSQAPSDFVASLERMAERADVVAATAITHVDVADCAERIQARGVPCFALLNDFAQGIRQGYLGLNNLKVGRIAGHMLATAIKKPGKIGVFVGGYRWHGHELRETGLKSYFRENAQQFTILDALVNLETRQLTYEATLDLLDRNPDLAGIYCAGGGMEGAITALREVRQPGEVALVVNELTPESRRALIDRYVTMVISTPLEKLCTDLVSLAAAALFDETKPPPGQHFLQPNLYLPESV
ncbi:Mgl repressor and galactose ultrainduction factor [Hartmannibacter diazotrophicus]|uniref:Mgl repressor and galactose ultrainduction factor n=1 Tax=Hartmannibacter diazotrophicus TaxID=1482074 RepID=A0A2C9D466_9HYPH|nr:LacI family DNA-binding transcriptional regulator [Hartmannibacter diazotrophicus]SON54958.1 Mgl repressor and galactose ultrainduction factor [Hartmannibacter diazotrophicus]